MDSGAGRAVARTLGTGLGVGFATGVLGLGYAVGIEARNFVVRRVEIPCLPAGHDPLRVLHISDLHLTPYQHRKRRWLASLATLEPDLVVVTGDNLAHMQSVGPVLEGMGSLLGRPGVFVFGSNDYYSPTVRNPLNYLRRDDGWRNTYTPKLPFEDLRRGFIDAGWLDLNNAGGRLDVGSTSIAFAGVDDPHLELDDLSTVGPAPTDADLRVGVAHAPYLRVLDAFAERGYELTLAGHTHGGQVCLPFYGTLVTNCDLDRARAKGLHRHPADSSPGQPGSTWLHVSAGAGTSPYTPIRFCCRPEATLATLTPLDTAALAPAA